MVTAFEGAQLDAAVGPVAGAVQHRHVTPRQAGAARQQGGLVGLDREPGVRVLLGHQELGCLGVGVEGVGGHDHAGQVERVQQRGEPRDFAGGAVDGALGQYRAGGVVHRGEQVELAAVGRLFGAAQGLAVDGDRPPVLAVTPVTVAQPGTDRRGQRLVVEVAQGAADGGLRGDRPVAGQGVAAGAQRGAHRLGRVGGPLGDRGHRAGAGQHRGGGQPQDAGQRVAAAGRAARVGDGGQVGEQVRGFGRGGAGRRRAARPGPAGSGMVGRQARASTRIMGQ